ncbi:MAG: hypothetical protein WC269_03960 [Candidatus Gracilibacteria bacterium]|jgi:hypothetical protein
MDKAQLQSELKQLIAKSHSLDEKKKTLYLAMIRVAPESRLNQLHEIFSKESETIFKANEQKLKTETAASENCMNRLNEFFTKEAKPVYKKIEEKTREEESKNGESLLNNI